MPERVGHADNQPTPVERRASTAPRPSRRGRRRRPRSTTRSERPHDGERAASTPGPPVGCERLPSWTCSGRQGTAPSPPGSALPPPSQPARSGGTAEERHAVPIRAACSGSSSRSRSRRGSPPTATGSSPASRASSASGRRSGARPSSFEAISSIGSPTPARHAARGEPAVPPARGGEAAGERRVPAGRWPASSTLAAAARPRARAQLEGPEAPVQDDGERERDDQQGRLPAGPAVDDHLLERLRMVVDEGRRTAGIQWSISVSGQAGVAGPNIPDIVGRQGRRQEEDQAGKEHSRTPASRRSQASPAPTPPSPSSPSSTSSTPRWPSR